MEVPKNIIYISNIKPFKTSGFIQVKIIHTWKHFNAQFDESLEIIIDDEKVN